MRRNLPRLKVEELPKDDPRTKLLMAKLKKDKAHPDALIEILHSAQNTYGYLPMNVLAVISREMCVPPSRIFGVVTFYHFFSLNKKGNHTCLVCTGTACYVKGALGLLDQIEKDFNVKPGQVTPDNEFGLQTARCIGACGLAPAVVIDEEVVAKVTPELITNKIRGKMGVKV